MGTQLPPCSVLSARTIVCSRRAPLCSSLPYSLPSLYARSTAGDNRTQSRIDTSASENSGSLAIAGESARVRRGLSRRLFDSPASACVSHLSLGERDYRRQTSSYTHSVHVRRLERAARGTCFCLASVFLALSFCSKRL